MLNLNRSAALLACALLTACGSTVQQHTTSAEPGALGGFGLPGSLDGEAAPPGFGPADGTPVTSTDQGGTGSLSGPGSGSGSGSGDSATGPDGVSNPSGTAASTPAGSGGGTTPATAGRGFDARNLYVGVTTQKDVAGATGGLGVSNLDFGDQEGQVRAVVEDINRRGGILGRRVMPVFYDHRTGTNPTTSAQAACGSFTEDRKVAFVINLVGAIDPTALRACLTSRKTPLVSGAFVTSDDESLKPQGSYFYSLPSTSYDAISAFWIDRLIANSYLGKWNPDLGASGTAPVMVGILYPDTPIGQRITKLMKRALAARNVAVGADFGVTNINDYSGAVLRFRDSGVTHVIGLDSSLLYFTIAAEQQHYRPRYGLTTYNAPTALLAANAPPGQLVGAVGIGWMPATDVDARNSPSTPNPGEAACREAMRKGDQNVASSGAATLALSYCDGFNLLLAGATQARSFDADQIRAAITKSGPTFKSAGTFVSGLSGKSISLPGAARDFVWKPECSCLVYTSLVSRRF